MGRADHRLEISIVYDIFRAYDIEHMVHLPVLDCIP